MVAVARTAVCLSLWLLLYQVRGSFVPPKMNATIQNILRHYKSSIRDAFNGKPVFPEELLRGKTETKKLVMGGVLGTYEKLLHQMLKELPTSSPQTADSTTTSPDSNTGLEPGEDVKTNLTYILTRINQLKRNKFQEEEKVLHELHDLKRIQVNNSLVQVKALWELPRMFEEASQVSQNSTRQRRRRRQAKSKARLRG